MVLNIELNVTNTVIPIKIEFFSLKTENILER